MKATIQKMPNYDAYAYLLWDVPAEHHAVLINNLYWQVGDNFLKSFWDVPGMEEASANFAAHGQSYWEQRLKMVPAQWERALERFAELAEGLDWYLTGSAAMRLYGIDVEPKDIDICCLRPVELAELNERVKHFVIEPIQECSNWFMAAYGSLFMDGAISVAFHNPGEAPGRHELNFVEWRGRRIELASLQQLRSDNFHYNRMDRVAAIEALMQRKPVA